MQKHMKKVLLALAIVTAFVAGTVGLQTYRTQNAVKTAEFLSHVTTPFGPTDVAAQSNWSSNLSENSPVGDMVGVFNVSADTAIVDGDLVEADTSTVTVGPGRFRLGVRKLALTKTSCLRCIGIAVGNIGTKRIGKVLTRGYHPGAFVGESALAANSFIKVSRTIPGSFIVGDTTSAHCGVALGRSSTAVSSGVRYKYKVWFWGTKQAGATL